MSTDTDIEHDILVTEYSWLLPSLAPDHLESYTEVNRVWQIYVCNTKPRRSDTAPCCQQLDQITRLAQQGPLADSKGFSGKSAL